MEWGEAFFSERDCFSNVRHFPWLMIRVCGGIEGGRGKAHFLGAKPREDEQAVVQVEKVGDAAHHLGLQRNGGGVWGWG